jgi:hypothetical protein
MRFSVCVYCGARSGGDPAYAAAAADLGAALAVRGWRLVYGGGSVGLMGVVARAALAAGGEVVGVIPRRLLDLEVGMHEVTELVVTETMRERKAIMFERSDVFVSLPGGFGTVEEVVETLTLRQLRYHNKPIFFLDTAGYYGPLLGFFQHTVAAGFAHPDQLGLYAVATDVPALLAMLEQAAS